MNPVMYIILNKGAKMSTGKAAAQAAHAAVEAYLATPDSNTKRVWHKGKHYAKVVLEAADADELLVHQKYIEDRGFATELIIDEGRTEIDPFTPTALGVQIVDKDHAHAAATFSSFKLYSDPSDTAFRDLVKDMQAGRYKLVQEKVGNDMLKAKLEKLQKPSRIKAFFAHRPFKRGWNK